MGTPSTSSKIDRIAFSSKSLNCPKLPPLDHVAVRQSSPRSSHRTLPPAAPTTANILHARMPSAPRPPPAALAGTPALPAPAHRRESNRSAPRSTAPDKPNRSPTNFRAGSRSPESRPLLRAPPRRSRSCPSSLADSPSESRPSSAKTHPHSMDSLPPPDPLRSQHLPLALHPPSGSPLNPKIPPPALAPPPKPENRAPCREKIPHRHAHSPISSAAVPPDIRPSP